MSTETLKWGLFGVAVGFDFPKGDRTVANLGQQTIKFINDEASSVHGALRASSIYTSESGEWRVGGFEVLSSMKDDDAIIYVRLEKYVKSPIADLAIELWKPRPRLRTIYPP